MRQILIPRDTHQETSPNIEIFRVAKIDRGHSSSDPSSRFSSARLLGFSNLPRLYIDIQPVLSRHCSALPNLRFNEYHEGCFGLGSDRDVRRRIIGLSPCKGWKTSMVHEGQALHELKHEGPGLLPIRKNRLCRWFYWRTVEIELDTHAMFRTLAEVLPGGTAVPPAT